MAQWGLVASLNPLQIPKPWLHHPSLPSTRGNLDTSCIERQTRCWAGGPAMCMTDSCVVVVRRVVQVAIGGIAFDKATVGHAWIVQHEVSPHELNEINGSIRESCEEMSLHLEPGRKW